MNNSVIVIQSIFGLAVFGLGLQVFAFAVVLEPEEVYVYADDCEFEYLIINDKEHSIVCH